MFLAIGAAIPFAAALAAGLCTGRMTPAAWTGLDADMRIRPVLFWLLAFFNAAMLAALMGVCFTLIG